MMFFDENEVQQKPSKRRNISGDRPMVKNPKPKVRYNRQEKYPLDVDSMLEEEMDDFEN